VLLDKYARFPLRSRACIPPVRTRLTDDLAQHLHASLGVPDQPPSIITRAAVSGFILATIVLNYRIRI
jgi:hypothetical protein